ncbi:response regulator transcription factor [Niabella drilacis]|uniref:Two component transcriptional regulator, LuxR family n=1 Tax=Niabella drilacis (strain DSM 25811 / CCM 8410 / CCUG 62505 / LMG 26954 / E90) TaxID=1285928 RepID=A0A1G6LKF6_NIADE|nr:response regulator transcription factor [Niabella drilacis]SDC43832.1 two component transcriptional regulator, LuxR family [Niabella drilacis]
MRRIKVAVLADEELSGNALVALLNREAEIELVSTFKDGESALSGIDKQPVDVLLFDIHLPGISGVEVVGLLKGRYSKMECIALTNDDADTAIFSALNAGASGYLLKDTDTAAVAEAVKDVYNGGFPMNSMVARKVIDRLFAAPAPGLQSEKLSLRENEVLLQLSKGHRYKEIAAHFFISVETVRTHIRNIYEKLQVNSRSEAIKKVKDSMNRYIQNT